MNLDKILKDVEEFEHVKKWGNHNPWNVGGVSIYQAKFIDAARKYPATKIIRELVDEVKR